MTKDELLQQADEFEELARSLLEHAHHLRSHSLTAERKGIFWPENAGDLSVVAESLLAARTQRLRHLDRSLLGEPAWDMMLFLFQSLKSGGCVTVDETCRSTGTFLSTARRWLTVLIDQGLVKTRDDDLADSLKPVQLTELGEIRMTTILVGVQDEFLQRGYLPVSTTVRRQII